MIKLLLVGPSRSGKSSILDRYVRDEFKEDMLTTIGVDFALKSIDVNGKIAKLQLVKENQWDTAGQERFRTVTSSYYRVPMGIIIVFDKSSQDSFNKAEEIYQEAVRLASDKAVFMLVGNKSDLESVVSTEQGHEAALRLGALYLEVSAKSNHNLENVFEVIAAQIIKNF